MLGEYKGFLCFKARGAVREIDGLSAGLVFGSYPFDGQYSEGEPMQSVCRLEEINLFLSILEDFLILLRRDLSSVEGVCGSCEIVR